MRLTSHCAYHPSREAGQRCRSCGKWLCDRCARPIQGHIFCGFKCRLHDLGKRGASGLSSTLRSPVPPLWAVLGVALTALALGSWIIVLGLRLISASGDSQSPAQDSPYAVADMVRDGDQVMIGIQGSPGATVVLFADGVPVRVLVLDEDGRASVTDIEVKTGSSIEIGVLAQPPTAVAPRPSSAPTPKTTLTATATPAATAPSAPKAITSPTTPPRKTATAPPTRSPSPELTRLTTRPGRTPTRPPSVRRKVEDRPAVFPPVLHLVTDAGNRIAVTFDGNASSNGTAELLDILQELDLHITLFVTGGFIERYPTLVRRALLAGHEVGNHTFSHPHLTSYANNKRHNLLPNVTKAWFQEQLIQTEAAFRKATGRPMAPLWRAPFGEENSTLRGWALELGYLHVRWSSLEGASLDARDWVADEHSKLYQNSRKMMDRLLGFPRLEGGIVLMHLATERSEPPWGELPRFVRELKRRDVRPVKISELLEASAIWRPWLERAEENHEKNFPE